MANKRRKPVTAQPALPTVRQTAFRVVVYAGSDAIDEFKFTESDLNVGVGSRALEWLLESVVRTAEEYLDG